MKGAFPRQAISRPYLLSVLTERKPTLTRPKQTMEKHNLSKEETQALIDSKIKHADETIATLKKESAALKRQNEINRWKNGCSIILLCIIVMIIFMAMCK